MDTSTCASLPRPCSHPRFNPMFRVVVVEGEGVYLLGEGRSHVLQGLSFELLAPLLDGSLTEEQLCERLEGRLAPAEIFYALALLRQQEFLAAGEPEEARSEAEDAFWEALGIPWAWAQERLRATRVNVLSLDGCDTSLLAERLLQTGLLPGPGEALSIVLSEDHLAPGLAAFNRARLADGRPWLLVRPSGLCAWLGPLFIPGRTGCWRCQAHRLEGHRRVERYLEHRLQQEGLHPPSRAGLPAFQQAIAGMVATFVARWAVEGRLPTLEGHILTVDAMTFETKLHSLVRRPQCPDCGDAGLLARRQAAPVRLEPSARAFVADGGHRELPPEETFARLSHHLSHVTGIVSRMVRLGHTEDDRRLLFSYSTDHNFALETANLGALRHSLRGFSGGKGRTDVQAKTSALCESIERYSGVWQGDEACLRATLEALGEEAIAPGRCLHFSVQQYAHREAWNRHAEGFCWVPVPFEQERPIEWSPVWSLTEERRRYVPTALCYYGYPFGGAPVFAVADSNGCAAGNTLTEAILQGFFELVERDAVALWWYNRLRQPGVALESFDEPYLPWVAEYWRSRGRALWVLDLTSDLGIPTFAAISRRLEGPFQAIIFGFGTHLDARIALLRAVTEHNQMVPWVFTGEPGSRLPEGLIFRWLREARVEQEPYLLPSETVAPRTQRDFPFAGGSDLREDVKTCVALARRSGLETLVLDQTRPDTGLAVARVLVPGLRHFWARLGPGRLYDVPVAMGALPAPLPEEALNPHPMFI